MKLLRLDLLAFGPLQTTTLDLASEAPCLHVVYGANEAGKSTALRALHGLFYGIPENTIDAHRFKASELRVAALLQDARGRELYVVRRKGRKQTLAAADGTPLAGADASWITAGMPEAQFRSMFALSYDTLEEGADELLGSAGELGQSLFSAGTGGTGAHAVLEALRHEADSLYRPRGRTQRLNGALAAFEEARRAVREQSIRAEAFAEQQRAIDEAETDAGRLQLQRHDLMAERVRLERARRVMPLLAKRGELRRQRAELGDVPVLPDSAAEERRLQERARRDAKLRIEHVDAEIAKLDAARAELHVNDAWLEPALQVQLSDLRDRLVHYRRAQRALPVRRHAHEREQAELHAMLERLGLSAAVEDLESLRVSRPLEARIREHARRGETAHARYTDLARQLAAKRDEVARQRAVLVARRFDPDASERQIELPLSPERVALNLAQVEEFERQSLELDRERRACADKLREEEDAFERTQRDLDALEHAGQPPTEAQLTAAREERRALSATLRAALRASPAAAPVQHATSDAASELAPARGAASSSPDCQTPEHLLHALDAKIDAADVIADRLRREATRVAEFARLRAAHAGSERQLERLQVARAALEARAADAHSRWLSLCARAGIPPRTPGQMRAFLADHRAEALRLSQLEHEASKLDRELDVEREARADWQLEWNQLIAKLGCRPSASVAEVDAMLSGLHDVFARVDAMKNDAREIDVLAHEASGFERELAALQVRLLPEAAPDAASNGWDSIADALLARDHAERRAAERCSQLEAQRTARNAERERAYHEHAATERELDVLMQVAGVTDLAALEAAEEAARRARTLDDSLAQVQAELLAAADGFEPAALEAELGHTSVPEVQARLQEVEDSLERADLERERAVHTLESRRMGLTRLRESRGAADAALDAGAALENVRLLAQRYVRVRLAFGVLSREVERYRERHTGPILRGASALFSQLTQGVWRGLEADFGDSDEPVLICVRANGERVGVRGLSAGTRDQLYLALRLASIEQLSAARELMPLVMDDLLVHFDDDRARAALRALGEFARVTQVLLFTHHTRVCELAREALPEGQIRFHRLAAPLAPARELSLVRSD
jgi:uncharacterized protein YhaN